MAVVVRVSVESAWTSVFAEAIVVELAIWAEVWSVSMPTAMAPPAARPPPARAPTPSVRLAASLAVTLRSPPVMIVEPSFTYAWVVPDRSTSEAPPASPALLPSPRPAVAESTCSRVKAETSTSWPA